MAIQVIRTAAAEPLQPQEPDDIPEETDDTPAHPYTHEGIVRVKLFEGQTASDVEGRANEWLGKNIAISILSMKMSVAEGKIVILVQYEYDHVPKKKNDDDE